MTQLMFFKYQTTKSFMALKQYDNLGREIADEFYQKFKNKQSKSSSTGKRQSL